MNYNQLLNAPYDETMTIKDALKKLLVTLISQRYNFNAKRPFGYSDYYWNFYEALGNAGISFIKIDEDGDIVDLDEKKAIDLMHKLINRIFEG